MTTIEFYRKVDKNIKRKTTTPCSDCGLIKYINVFGIIKCEECGKSKGDIYNFNEVDQMILGGRGQK